MVIRRKNAPLAREIDGFGGGHLAQGDHAALPAERGGALIRGAPMEADGRGRWRPCSLPAASQHLEWVWVPGTV